VLVGAIEEVLLRLRLTVLVVVLLSLLGACSNGASPEAAVETYLESLIEGDQVGAINASCADWEAQARAEAASFDSVEARLEGVSCSVSGESGDFSLVSCQGAIIATYGTEDTVVSCQGAIIATYGTEDTELALEGRSYQIIEEGGEWRMCGYQ
jgi:hypothetical protein